MTVLEESPTKVAARLNLPTRRNGIALTYDELLNLAVKAYWQRRPTAVGRVS